MHLTGVIAFLADAIITVVLPVRIHYDYLHINTFFWRHFASNSTEERFIVSFSFAWGNQMVLLLHSRASISALKIYYTCEFIVVNPPIILNSQETCGFEKETIRIAHLIYTAVCDPTLILSVVVKCDFHLIPPTPSLRLTAFSFIIRHHQPIHLQSFILIRLE